MEYTLDLGFIIIEVGHGLQSFQLNNSDVVHCGGPVHVGVVAHVLYLALVLEDHLQLGMAIRADPNIRRSALLIC